MAFYSIDRVLRLGLDGVIDYIFTPPDHAIPDHVVKYTNREKYRLTKSKHLSVPEGVTKPNPEVLLDILRDINREEGDCVYVGDSLMKDIAMAQDAKVLDVHAEYGLVQDHAGYPFLRKVSHWTDEDVRREQEISRRTIDPSHTISNFSQIKNFFGPI